MSSYSRAFYESRWTPGGISYYSGSSTPSRRWNRERRRNLPNSHQLDVNELFFKYRQYAPQDADINRKGMDALSLDLNKDANRQEHKTDKYGNSSLIVRRGWQFNIFLQMKLQFNKNEDSIDIILSKGPRPKETKGTMVRLMVAKDKASVGTDAREWKAYIVSERNKTIEIAIIPSTTALVGSYSITTKVRCKDLSEEKSRFVKEEDEKLIVLFNPWCKGDQVYMPKQSDLEEYVLNETGKIWVGSDKRNSGKPWAFSQFSKDCLAAALFILDESTVKPEGHGNATRVCRALSAMVNSCDNPKGVLQGNWSGNYSGGTSPTSWTGSWAILKEYMQTKRSVKYGQCWVFSGLLTTMGRALGIPTRSITNFQSAHDSDNTLSIDTHFNTKLKNVPELDDSTWNFHVWNEAWFQRPDLPSGYDGWQAFDATPQEQSEGMMRCGPASVKAIKEGNVYLCYDAGFIFAEVNGDKVVWLQMPGGEFKPVQVDSSAVGKVISTKAVGSGLRQDVTLDYKYPEGSNEERQAVARASNFSSKSDVLSKLYMKDMDKDVDFNYVSPINARGDVHITVTATNTSAEERTVELKFSASAVYYTGVVGMDFDERDEHVVIPPGEAKDFHFDLESKEYLNIIDEDAKIKVFVTGLVTETGYFYQESEIFHVEKPDLEMEVSTKRPKVGEELELTMSFENTLDVSLTSCMIFLEGPGIQKRKKIHLHRNIRPGEIVKHKEVLTPKYHGTREVIAVFHSRQMVEVTGSVEIETV